MDLEDAGSQARFLIRDRDGKYPALFGTVLKDAGIQTVLSGVQMPRMNSIMERWVRHAAMSCWTARSSGTSATSCTRCGSSSTSTTSTGLTGPSEPPHPCIRYPTRSPIPGRSRNWTSEDKTGSAALSTNTSMPPDQHG